MRWILYCHLFLSCFVVYIPYFVSYTFHVLCLSVLCKASGRALRYQKTGNCITGIASPWSGYSISNKQCCFLLWVQVSCNPTRHTENSKLWIGEPCSMRLTPTMKSVYDIWYLMDDVHVFCSYNLQIWQSRKLVTVKYYLLQYLKYHLAAIADWDKNHRPTPFHTVFETSKQNQMPSSDEYYRTIWLYARTDSNMLWDHAISSTVQSCKGCMRCAGNLSAHYKINVQANMNLLHGCHKGILQCLKHLFGPPSKFLGPQTMLEQL